MHNPIHDVFGTLHTPEQLKRKTKAALRARTFDYGRDLARLRSHRRRLAGGFLSLALVLSGLGLWFLPTTAIGLKKGQVFGLIIGETCTMALMGGLLGSALALLAMNPVIELLKDSFKLSPSVWSAPLALLCCWRDCWASLPPFLRR